MRFDANFTNYFWQQMGTDETQMNANLPIPKELEALIAQGFWPGNKDASRAQNLKPIIQSSVISRFAPGEPTIFLYPPPFHTVEAEIDGGNPAFWEEFGAISEIDPAKTLIIGDFGLGSDTAIALEYGRNDLEPKVIRLVWGPEGNHWLEVAPSFREFAEMLK